MLPRMPGTTCRRIDYLHTENWPASPAGHEQAAQGRDPTGTFTAGSCTVSLALIARDRRHEIGPAGGRTDRHGVVLTGRAFDVGQRRRQIRQRCRRRCGQNSGYVACAVRCCGVEVPRPRQSGTRIGKSLDGTTRAGRARQLVEGRRITPGRSGCGGALENSIGLPPFEWIEFLVIVFRRVIASPIAIPALLLKTMVLAGPMMLSRAPSWRRTPNVFRKGICPDASAPMILPTT